MKRLLRAVGWAPPAVALACLAWLGARTFGPLWHSAAGAGESPLYHCGAVPDAWLDGLALLRSGDAAGALRQLSAAESLLGVAPPPLLRARLHAALAANDWVDAELTAEKLALRAGEEALRNFVVGLAEHARGERAGFEAEQPGADPTAFDRAIRHATAAALAFQAASLAAPGGDWPAARRNAERAAIRRSQLQRKKEQAERDAKRRREQQQQEPEPEEIEEIEQQLQLAEVGGLLSAAELQALLRRLAEAEEEKRSVRRALRDQRSAAVEQDW